RFGEPALLAVLRRKAAELNQAGLVRMERQRELLQPVAHRLPEAASVALMLEADDKSSSGGEFHPSALTEPDVRLSPHPAPTLQPPVARRVATGRTGWGPAARCIPASASTHVPGA